MSEKQATPPRTPYTLRIEPELLSALRTVAKDRKVSVSDLLREGARQFADLPKTLTRPANQSSYTLSDYRNLAIIRGMDVMFSCLCCCECKFFRINECGYPAGRLTLSPIGRYTPACSYFAPPIIGSIFDIDLSAVRGLEVL